MAITEKLSKIQSELKAPKGQYNKFGNFFYRSCEDILEGLKPLLKSTKTALTISDEIIYIGDRYYIRATAALYDQESGETVSTRAYAREPDKRQGMDASQVTGSASSYARKYALNGLFCIDDNKDPDASAQAQEEEKPKKTRARKAKAAEKKEEPKPAAAAVAPEDIQNLINIMEMKGCPLDPVLKRYKIKKLEDITPAQYQNAINSLGMMPDRAAG